MCLGGAAWPRVNRGGRGWRPASPRVMERVGRQGEGSFPAVIGLACQFRLLRDVGIPAAGTRGGESVFREGKAV